MKLWAVKSLLDTDGFHYTIKVEIPTFFSWLLRKSPPVKEYWGSGTVWYEINRKYKFLTRCSTYMERFLADVYMTKEYNRIHAEEKKKQ